VTSHVGSVVRSAADIASPAVCVCECARFRRVLLYCFNDCIVCHRHVIRHSEASLSAEAVYVPKMLRRAAFHQDRLCTWGSGHFPSDISPPKQFLLRFYRAMLCIARTMPSQIIRLSARRMPVCCRNAKHILTFFTSHIILVFFSYQTA